MKIKVLASGSKGNSTYLKCNNTSLLIDVGISYTKIYNALQKIDVSPKDIDGILITHTHSDHIGGLASYVKKNKVKVYITIELLKELKKIVPIDQIILIKDEFQIEDINITLLHASHDVACYGYLIEHGNKSLVYLTDTGYINQRYFKLTKDKNIYIIEANHDEEMLMNGPYPYSIKQRVISDSGHLSNTYTGRYLAKTIGNNTKYILLAHISDNNNTKELALEQVSEELKKTDFNLENIIVTEQNESTKEVEV